MNSLYYVKSICKITTLATPSTTSPRRFQYGDYLIRSRDVETRKLKMKTGETYDE